MAEVFYHNWMYSFIPGREENPDGPINIYLCGYDKTCNQAFTVKLNMDSAVGFVALTQTNVPKEGCNIGTYNLDITRLNERN